MFYITISNGLLTKDHYKRMGAAVWEFMWLIDKITKIDEEGWGIVLGGKPINLKDMPFGHETTISRNLQKLEQMEYLKLTHTPYGIIVKVAKAKKRFSKSAKAEEGERISENAKPNCKNAKPNIRQLPKGNQLDTLKSNRTPREIAIEFFKSPDKQEEVIQALVGKGMNESQTRSEISRFINYWTELTPSGRKQRWETQNTFEVNRRLATWFNNAVQFQSKNKINTDRVVI